MDIRVNGEPHAVDHGATVARLLDDLGIAREGVAVEVNRTIVARAAYESHRLEQDDQVEIVRFVGGG